MDLKDLMAIDEGNRWLRMIPESRQILRASTAVASKTLHAAYRSGAMQGVIIDAPGVPWYIREAARYTRAALADLRDYPLVWEESEEYAKVKGKGADTGFNFGWHNWLRLDPAKASKGNQATGDCVSWAIRGARDRLRCNQILDAGAIEAYVLRQATCGLYSGRGHTGQGAEPGRISQYGVLIGTLLEKQYLNGKYDFRNYSDYVQWGMSRGRVGMPDDLLEDTQQYTDERTFMVTTWDGWVDGLAAGYTGHAGSMLGISSTGNPISSPSGSWSHDMDYPGFDVTRNNVNQDVTFVDNSWGEWNRVSNIPDAWKPWAEGMAAITRSTFESRVLPARGTWLFVPGEYFPGTPINNLLI